MRWTIWTLKTHTGDKADCIAWFFNRGHAIQALRGYRSRAWRAGSEMCYTLQRESNQ